jgi:hypothetical protein
LSSFGAKGDRRAIAVYIRYQELALEVANGPVQITFADSDYTRAFSPHDVGSSGDE